MEDEDSPDTRVFVSGLPPNLTSNQLGAHFAGRYQITDAVVVPDRRIGFVGFRNYTLAKSAIKYFDKSYIRMSKISVTMAKPVEIERSSTSQRIPMSKHSRKETERGPSHSKKVTTNGNNASDNTSSPNAAFQPYVPIEGLNKRKRESQSKPLDESLNSTTAVLLTNVTPGHKMDTGRSADEENREMKKAKRKEQKSYKGEADAEESQGEKNREAESVVATVVTKLKKKKPIQVAVESGSDGDASRTRAKPGSRLQESEKAEETKKKKKKKESRKDDASAISADGEIWQSANPSDGGVVRQGPNRSYELDNDTKGGVEPLDKDTSGSPGQSADRIEQQRQKSDVTNDNEWLRAKTSRLLDLMGSDLEDDEPATPRPENRSNEAVPTRQDEKTAQPTTSSMSPPGTSTQDYLSSTGRLFVRNLPYTANESEIENLFSKYGRLKEVHLVRDKSGSSKGIGYVQFADADNAKHALEGSDGKSFQGRLLHILEARERRSQTLDEYEISKLPLKKQKALKRKVGASGSTFNWNSMYMNPNAVLASVADRLGVAKSDLIDPTSSDAAVKQAHAETHVIQETRAFLVSYGVNLEAFKEAEKDERTLLVKNFPFGTSAEELKGLFRPYGEIIKCLIPPSGTIAIMQYAQPGEGSQAMRQLAYRNFNGSVLYLEKAPKNLFDPGARSTSDEKSAATRAPVAQKSQDSGEGTESSSATLFVRNLNFATTTAGLTNAFKPLGGFLSARVKTKVDPKRPQEILSMGFGFVEFSSNQQARAALTAMNGHRLDNHELLIQISRKATDAAEEQRQKHISKTKEAHKTKIIIKNLPFEANKKDVRSLLGAYGQLRSVKLPQKFDRSTRGFAFADFVTAKEAENVMEALRDTHLLGRRLVLEYAQEESVDPEDEIRAIESKVERQTEMIHRSNMTGTGRRKFNVGTEGDPESL